MVIVQCQSSSKQVMRSSTHTAGQWLQTISSQQLGHSHTLVAKLHTPILGIVCEFATGFQRSPYKRNTTRACNGATGCLAGWRRGPLKRICCGRSPPALDHMARPPLVNLV